MFVYQSILERFRGIKPLQQPNRWLAFCPAHEDGRSNGQRSLVISVNDAGKLTAHCFAGCRWEAIVAAAGSRREEWFPDFWERGPEPRRRLVQRIIATYDYQDETGKLLYQVCRHEHVAEDGPDKGKTVKGFSQRRPDPSFRDGFHWGLGDVRRVLYRLPELIAGKDRLVIVVEGEKDANRLHSLGCLATTNSGGANAEWLPEFSRTLAGRRVAIIPDNDPPGRRHAWLIAGSLLQHGVGSVRLVELPGVPEKGDVSDWLDAGHGLADLKQLIIATVEWKASKVVLSARTDATSTPTRRPA